MRKLVSAIENNGLVALPPGFQPSLLLSHRFSPSTLLSPKISPSPSPSSLSPPQGDCDHCEYRNLSSYVPSIPITDSVFDLATLSLISGLILLSFLSVFFIFHLRIKSRRAQHLQKFNNLWSVRLLLVLFVSMWALNEILRLPFFRRQYLYPFLPPLTFAQQTNLCKVHVILSLGVYEPGFFMTLLFLVNISIQRRNIALHTWTIATIFASCVPLFLLQTFFGYLSPLEAQLPVAFHRNSVLSKDAFGNKSVMCTYPLCSCLVFAVFGIAYCLGFMLSCWRVLSLVINKGIRTRINVLAFAVMMALPIQILFMGMSSFWTPENTAYDGVVLVMFLCVALCASVGEAILVIKPIVDALAAGGDCCSWAPPSGLRTTCVDGGRGDGVLPNSNQ